MPLAAGSSRRGRACCGCWLVAALGASCWGQPCATAAGWSRRVRAAARRSGHLPSVGQRFSLGPIDVCRAEPSISLPSARGRFVFVRVRGVDPAPRDLPERAASRIRALLRPPLYRSSSPHREAWRRCARGAIYTQCDRRSKRPCRAAANRASRPFHHRGLRFAPPLQLNASQPWARRSRPSPPRRRSPSRACPARSTTATGRRRRAASRRRARRRAQQ